MPEENEMIMARTDMRGLIEKCGVLSDDDIRWIWRHVADCVATNDDVAALTTMEAMLDPNGSMPPTLRDSMVSMMNEFAAAGKERTLRKVMLEFDPEQKFMQVGLDEHINNIPKFSGNPMAAATGMEATTRTFFVSFSTSMHWLGVTAVEATSAKDVPGVLSRSQLTPQGWPDRYPDGFAAVVLVPEGEEEKVGGIKDRFVTDRAEFMEHIDTDLVREWAGSSV